MSLSSIHMVRVILSDNDRDQNINGTITCLDALQCAYHLLCIMNTSATNLKMICVCVIHTGYRYVELSLGIKNYKDGNTLIVWSP